MYCFEVDYFKAKKKCVFYKFYGSSKLGLFLCGMQLWLRFWFNGTSTLLDYLMPNLVYTLNIYIYIYYMCVCVCVCVICK